MSASCAMEETREGRLAQAVALSVMAPAAWYGCVAPHCPVLCAMHQGLLNNPHSFLHVC